MPNALIDILTGKDAKAAYALLLQLEEQSERDPGLYPLLGDFLAMLESDNSLVRARGFRLTVAQALWDSDNVIDSRIDDVLALLRDPKGTTARQSLQFAYVLLDAKPYLFPYVAEALESMDLSRYPDGIRPLIADDANRLASQADECRRLFLRPTDWIDWGDEAVLNRAALIGRGSGGVVDLAEATFEFVRDEIAHSYDVGCHVPAAKASDVLKTGASICWGKANLLAALLRANGIPAGISYQVLTKGEDAGSGYMVHALNTAYLKGHGWIRMDARGNREGIDARFSLTKERLAYRVRPEEGERDLRNNAFDADPSLMGLIEGSSGILDVSSESVLDGFEGGLTYANRRVGERIPSWSEAHGHCHA